MKHINSILYISISFISYTQESKNEELKLSEIRENPKIFLKKGVVVTDDLLRNNLTDKIIKSERHPEEFVIHFELQISFEESLEKIKQLMEIISKPKIYGLIKIKLNIVTCRIFLLRSI